MRSVGRLAAACRAALAAQQEAGRTWMEADTKKYCCLRRSSLPYSVASLGYLPPGAPALSGTVLPQARRGPTTLLHCMHGCAEGEAAGTPERSQDC